MKEIHEFSATSEKIFQNAFYYKKSACKVTSFVRTLRA